MGQEDIVSQRIEDALDADASIAFIATVRESKRFGAPSVLPTTLSAICP